MAAASSKHVPKRQPVLFDQDLEAFKRPVVRIKHQLWKSAHLRCPVPSVWTVNQHIDAVIYQWIHNVVSRFQNVSNHLSIPCFFQFFLEVVLSFLVSHIAHFFVGFSDIVNVANIAKLQFAIRVAVPPASLVSTTLEHVSCRVEPGASIKNLDCNRLFIRTTQTYLFQKLNIMQLLGEWAENVWLWRTPDWNSFVFVVPRQRR